MTNRKTPEAQPTRAAVYCRVSSEEQVLGSSLDDQEQRGQEASFARGMTTVGVYRDEGVTGTTADRPAWNQLMASCRSGEVDVVFATKWDRIARNARVGLDIAAALEDLDIALVVLDADFDNTTSNGKLMRHMLVGFAALERDMIVERMARGQRAMAERGFYPGGGAAAFGYRATGGATNRLVIEEDEANILRMAVSLIVDDGLTTGQTCRVLNDAGYKTRYGREWKHGNLRRHLMQRVLVGEILWANTEKTHRSYVPSGKYGPGILLQWEPIIDEARFDALQLALSRTAHGKRGAGSNRAYPLSQRMVCACGAYYIAASYGRNKARQYQCRRATGPANDRCFAPRIDADWIDAEVWSAIAGLLSDPEQLLASAQEYLGLRRSQLRVEKDESSVIERRVATLERALVRLEKERLLADEPDVFSQAARELKAELVEARRLLAQLREWKADSAAESARVRSIWELAESAVDRLDELTDQERQEVITLLDIKVSVRDDLAEISVPTKYRRGRGVERPDLRIEGSVPSQQLLSVIRPNRLTVAGSPPVSLRRRGSARVASAALP
jgi:site-specific DNA recombinase